jgi:hypothetical protein
MIGSEKASPELNSAARVVDSMGRGSENPAAQADLVMERFDLSNHQNFHLERRIVAFRRLSFAGSGTCVAAAAYVVYFHGIVSRLPVVLLEAAYAAALLAGGLIAPAGHAVEMTISDSRLSFTFTGGRVVEFSRVKVRRRVIVLHRRVDARGRSPGDAEQSQYVARIGLRWVILSRPALDAFVEHLTRLGYRRHDDSRSRRPVSNILSRVVYSQDR